MGVVCFQIYRNWTVAVNTQRTSTCKHRGRKGVPFPLFLLCLTRKQKKTNGTELLPKEIGVAATIKFRVWSVFPGDCCKAYALHVTNFQFEFSGACKSFIMQENNTSICMMSESHGDCECIKLGVVIGLFTHSLFFINNHSTPILLSGNTRLEAIASSSQAMVS